MSFRIEVAGGQIAKLPTAGKYCDRDIIVTGMGYTEDDLWAEYEAGLTEGEELCAANHFTHAFTGSGSTSVSFHVPFEPDFLHLFGYDPLGMYTSGAAIDFTCDLRAFGLLAGFVQYGNGSGGLSNAAITASALPKRYSRDPDGTIRIFDLGGTKTTVTFPDQFHYTAIALKYTDLTDKERILVFLDRLTDSGSVTLQQSKVNAAFSDAEWAVAIADKPNWTFNWI